jgi:hypothetical protein
VKSWPRKRRWFRWAGIAFLLAGCLGFLTVADDLRHTGELLGVAGVACAGLSLVVASTENRVSTRVAPQWVAAGIGVGELVGAAVDNMLVGVCGGVVVGLLLAIVLFPKRARGKVDARAASSSW